MLKVRVREKHQLTLPMAIVRAAGIRLQDELEVRYCNGVITLATPLAARAQRPLRQYVGALQGVYGNTAAEVHAYLQNERDAWEDTPHSGA